MKDKKIKYITTTLPYINASPHIGHALEFVQADALKRFETLLGYEVFLNIGTDEYGTKVAQTAKEQHLQPQVYANKIAKEYKKLLKTLNIKPTNFIRTTDRVHKKAVIKIWKTIYKNGDIYKNKHTGMYCVGCELFKKEEELINNECPLHEGKKLEFVEEENYFFKLSKYQTKLLDLYKSNPSFVIPSQRQKELVSFVENGLEDISISREISRLSWGIRVPGDKTQIIYVWFDALTNYLTTIGWGKSFYEFWRPNWKNYWPVIQLAGKDNLRQQSVTFQAMLLAAGIEPSRVIFIHGFLTSGGKKMSKTTGNVILPNELIEIYGADFFRLYVLGALNAYEDSDVTKEYYKEFYLARAVRGIGNLNSRIMTLSSKHLKYTNYQTTPKSYLFEKEYINNFRKFNYKEAVEVIFQKIRLLDIRIAQKQPYKLIKTNKEAGIKEIKYLVDELHSIAHHLKPIMPNTAKKIISTIKNNIKPVPMFKE